MNKVHKPEKREAFGRTGLHRVAVVACLGITVVRGALSHSKPESVFMLPLQLNWLFFRERNLIVLTSSFLADLATSENISHTTELHSRSIRNFYSNIFFQFLQSADKPRTLARNSPWPADIVFSYPRCCNKKKLCISVIERNGFM
jgi:hypothetical protein